MSLDELRLYQEADKRSHAMQNSAPSLLKAVLVDQNNRFVEEMAHQLEGEGHNGNDNNNGSTGTSSEEEEEEEGLAMRKMVQFDLGRNEEFEDDGNSNAAMAAAVAARAQARARARVRGDSYGGYYGDNDRGDYDSSATTSDDDDDSGDNIGGGDYYRHHHHRQGSQRPTLSEGAQRGARRAIYNLNRRSSSSAKLPGAGRYFRR